LLRVRGFREQTLIGRDREIERGGIVIGTGQARGIVRQRGARELVVRKLARDLQPTIDTRAEVRLGKRPQVPRAAIACVGLFGSARQRTDDLRAATGQPVRVCQHYHRLRVLWTRRDDVLVRGYDDLWHVVIWPRGFRELLRISERGERAHPIEQRTDVGRDAILFHDLREAEIRRRRTRFHAPILFAKRAGVSLATAPDIPVTTHAASQREQVSILLIAEGEDRASSLRSQLAMVFPRASVTTTDVEVLSEGRLPEVDIALIDSGEVARGAADSLRLLRARGFANPVVIVTPVPDDANLCGAAQSLGARCIARDDADPIALGTALTGALGGDSALSPELAQARRVFAAGQAALSLQHGINNPLAALLAEAQLLQMEDLTSDQRASADRMVELCRRIVTLVKRLDAIADS